MAGATVACGAEVAEATGVAVEGSEVAGAAVGAMGSKEVGLWTLG